MIKAISIARDDCHELDSPEGLPSPPSQGWKPGESVYRVPVDYYESPPQLNLMEGTGQDMYSQ